MSCLKSALPSIQPISNSSLRFSSGSSPSRITICKPKSSSTIIQSFEGLAPLHPLLSLFSQDSTSFENSFTIIDNGGRVFAMRHGRKVPKLNRPPDQRRALLRGLTAIPQHSIDPILAASNVIVSLQHLVSREADPLDSQVVTVAKFQGGGAFNVIPDSVTIGGTFRAFSKESFLQLRQRIEEVIVGQAAVQRCNATVDFLTNSKPFFPPTVNDKNLHKHFQRVAGDMLGNDHVKDMEPLMGSEDFAFYQEVIPGYFYMLGMQGETNENPASVHSPYFKINEEALPLGAALQASLAITYLLEAQPQVPSSSINGHDEL